MPAFPRHQFTLGVSQMTHFHDLMLIFAPLASPAPSPGSQNPSPRGVFPPKSPVPHSQPIPLFAELILTLQNHQWAEEAPKTPKMLQSVMGKLCGSENAASRLGVHYQQFKICCFALAWMGAAPVIIRNLWTAGTKKLYKNKGKAGIIFSGNLELPRLL